MANFFKFGAPIKPHVDKLMDQIDPQAGEIYRHHHIARIAGVTYPSDRYFSIIQAWRKRLLVEKNMDILVENGIGYRVLKEGERISAGLNDYRLSVRRMGKSINRVAAARREELTQEQKRQQEHAIRLGTMIVQSAKSASKEIAYAGKINVMPRPKIPGI